MAGASLWQVSHRAEAMAAPESADASMASLGSQLTTSSAAATQRLSDSVSSRLGHWRGFKVPTLAHLS